MSFLSVTSAMWRLPITFLTLAQLPQTGEAWRNIVVGKQGLDVKEELP